MSNILTFFLEISPQRFMFLVFFIFPVFMILAKRFLLFRLKIIKKGSRFSIFYEYLFMSMIIVYNLYYIVDSYVY